MSSDAPRNDGVDQSITSAVVELVGGESLPHEVVAIVRLCEISAEMHPGDAPGFAGIGLEQHLLVGRENLVRTEDRARARRVIGRDEVGVRTVGLLGGEGQHLRTERGEQTPVARGRRVRTEGRGIHAVEIRPHRRQRFGVRATAQILDEPRMTHAQAQHETIGKRLVERALTVDRRHCITVVDRRDTGDDGHRCVAVNNNVALTNTLRLVASGTQMALQPISSISAASSLLRDHG